MIRMPSAIAVLFAIAALPAFAAEQTGPIATPLQIADNGDAASQKDQYEAQARHEMDIWQQRMNEAGAQTQRGLDRAWRATKDQWAYLQKATADGWDRSRIAFERASEQMKREWHKYHPNDE
jgi:hypothetical protein